MHLVLNTTEVSKQWAGAQIRWSHAGIIGFSVQIMRTQFTLTSKKECTNSDKWKVKKFLTSGMVWPKNSKDVTRSVSPLESIFSLFSNSICNDMTFYTYITPSLRTREVWLCQILALDSARPIGSNRVTSPSQQLEDWATCLYLEQIVKSIPSHVIDDNEREVSSQGKNENVPLEVGT